MIFYIFQDVKSCEYHVHVQSKRCVMCYMVCVLWDTCLLPCALWCVLCGVRCVLLMPLMVLWGDCCVYVVECVPLCVIMSLCWLYICVCVGICVFCWCVCDSAYMFLSLLLMVRVFVCGGGVCL